MDQMDQNRWAKCAKIDQNERNEMGWRELGHKNDEIWTKMDLQNESNAPK